MAKGYNIPISVDTEERVKIHAFRVDLKWREPRVNAIAGAPEVWSEYFFESQFGLDNFSKAVESSFGEDFHILKVEEIEVKSW